MFLLGFFMSNVDKIKFTSFESYHAYNVFCLTFMRNIRVLIERKTSSVISRKDKCLKKVPKNRKRQDGGSYDHAPQGTVVLQWMGPCTARHTAMHRGTVMPPRPTWMSVFSGLFNAISFPIFGRVLLARFS